MNNSANIKQFQLIKFINENCDDDHLISKISIVLRRDKIEAPYYMDTKIRLSTCIDRQENGLIHAKDESDQMKIFKDEKRLKIVLTSKNDEEIRTLFENCHELFDRIDNLVD